MKKPVIVVDIMREVVEKVSVAMQTKIGKTIQYMHGAPEEIEANLIEITANQSYTGEVKYPLIILFQDFPEDIGGTSGYYGVVRIPKIIIATSTDNTYKAPKRYEVSFKPILYPIYEEFKTQITKCRSLVVSDDESSLKHTKIDRLYWGTKPAGGDGKGKQGLNDYVDAIEIANLQLTLKQFC